MSELTTIDQYVSVARAATLLGISQADVSDLLQHNEIESRTLILGSSLAAYMAGGESR